MSKKEYKTLLTNTINDNGYWSNEVYKLNNKALVLFGVNVYTKLQNEVLEKLRK